MKKLLTVVVLLVVSGAVVWYAMAGGADEELQFFASAVERGDIQNTVAATGNVQAVVNVQVGSQVTGQIQSLYADFNSVVTQGQLLAKLDPRNLETQLENARANLISARARIQTAEADLTNSRAGVASAEANLVSARVDLEKAEIDLRRANELFEAELIPMSELENAGTTVESARARLAQNLAGVQQAEAQIISREGRSGSGRGSARAGRGSGPGSRSQPGIHRYQLPRRWCRYFQRSGRGADRFGQHFGTDPVPDCERSDTHAG